MQLDLERKPADDRREHREQPPQPHRAEHSQRALACLEPVRLEHARQAEHVVGVEVGEVDLVDLDQPDRADELALGALAAVEQQPLAAAPHERGGQPAPRGRRGRGGAGEEHVEVHGAPILATARRSALDASSSPTSSKDRCRRRPARGPSCARARGGARWGCPGLKIWKPLSSSCSGQVRVAEDDGVRSRGSARGAGRGARRRARRRGPSRSARPPHSTMRSAGSCRRSSSSSTLPCTASTGGPISSRSARRGRRHHVAGVQDQLGRRAADPGKRPGSRRLPRGRWVSEITAITLGLDWADGARSSVDRALPSGGRSRKFESCRARHQKIPATARFAHHIAPLSPTN